MTRFPAVVALTVAAIGCSSERPEAEATVHPSPTFRVNVGESDRHISLSAPLAASHVAAALEATVRQEPILSLGAPEAPPEQVFGAITDIAVDAKGRIYVLDARVGEVRVFDQRGVHLESVGRAGRGPGEFLRALSLAVDDSGTLYVGDVSEQVHIFAPGATGFTHDTSFSTTVSADDLCLLGDEVIVHGVSPTDTMVIHRYTRHGERVASFGTVYRSTHERANMEAARGRITCATDRGVVYYAPEGMLGEIRAFSLDGEQLWRTGIDDFISIGVQSTPTTFQATIRPSGFDRIDAIAMYGDSSLLAQVVHVTPSRDAPESGLEVSRITTLAISPQTGEATIVSRTAERILVIGRGRFIVASDDPYPRLRAFQFPAFETGQ